ncbi:ABC transporter ATP-binding protein [Janibacter limosus]|uniref:ABC transporter ATP-binding protein n=1 Tax=Janibacter limosus TaxID=53458 RepID=A0A4P6MVD0_9MICO|nr:ABC transporter ATP-binding protein [Janibacter limosus]QBF45510.1 ABC transporter ATP-binding protein [Janibacter limosus]
MDTPKNRSRRIDPQDRAQLAESPVSARRIIGYFRPHRWQVAVVVGLIVASSLIAMASPFLLRAIIDDALPHQDVRLLLLAVGGMLLVTIATALIGVQQTWISTRVGQAVMHRLRTDVFTHLQRQAMSFFTRTRSGEIQSRITQDVAGMQSIVTSTAVSIASNLTTAVATAVAMVALSWRLSLLSLLVLPPAIWTTRKVALARRDITAKRQRRLADLQAQVTEELSVSGALLSKTLGAAERGAREFTATSTDLVGLEVRSELAGRWRMATMSIVFAAIPALIYLAAGLPATSGGMTIGTIIAFTTLQSGIFRPVMGLLNVGASWVASMALFSRVFGYLDLEPEVTPPADPVAIDPATVRGELRIDGVSYGYPGSDRLALDGISAGVPAGAHLALVGATGSGKSTLASLVVRLADPTSGRITVDGVDLRDIDPQTLTQVIGIVTQETYLAHDSIRANLLLADPGATEAQLWQALAVAQAADLVAGLPDGLDTVVGARGHRFSGGEKQRIAIARTLLRDPAVLVLDEATSALDNDTERELQTALDALARGRTTITIAHRLSTIESADEILVLSGGRVVERGEHTDLVASGGTYARLAGGVNDLALTA